MSSASSYADKKESIVSVSKENTKDAKRLAVSVAVLEVIQKEGLLGVTHSKVARKAKVSRAWIYEYIGKEKSALIEFAADEFGSHIARAKLTEFPKTIAELEERFNEGSNFLFDSLGLSPVLIKLYYQHRGSANPLGRVIQKYEGQWLDGAARTLADVMAMSSTQASLVAELVLILRLGYMHRVATSAAPEHARARANEIFSAILTGRELLYPANVNN